MPTPPYITHKFLAGGGEMGALIRAYDWESSSLGSPEFWPQALKTSVRLMLSTGHPMYLWWDDDLIQFYNDAFSRSLGPERHPSVLGRPGRECWEEIWHIIGPQIEGVLAGEGYTWHVNQLVPTTRHGRKEDVYWTYSYGPIDHPSSPSGVGGVLVVCTETTEQILNEQRLKESDVRWRALFNQAPSFMCILHGPQHVFEYANPRYFELVNRSDIIGKPLREALPEVEGQGFLVLLDHVYRTGETHHGQDMPILLSTDSLREPEHHYLNFVYQAIRDETGVVTGIFVDGYDVTERVLTAKSLVNEDKRKDEFLAMLSHELRNPLAPISSASELLLQLAEEGSETQKIGQLLTRQVGQLKQLVDDLLDISRISQGQITLQSRTLELGYILDCAMESAHWQMLQKRQMLHWHGCPEPVYVEGDESRLIQSFSNVLINASKFTDTGGWIKIDVQPANDMVNIIIRDNGIGLSKENLKNIFDIFVQADRDLDRSQGGLGIGLCVVNKMIAMHGGQIAAASEGLGQGAKFTISLPRTECQDTDTITTVQAPLSSIRILVVDDNVDAADSLATLLQFKGHSTAVAYNANDAIQLAQTNSFQVLLMDIGLPEINGYEAAQQIRESNVDYKLIAVTGYGQTKDIQKALDAGFDAHVTKPVVLDELERLIAKVMDSTQQRN